MRNSLVLALFAASVAAAFAQEKSWETSISLGINETKGNSETMTLNAGVLSQKKTDADAWRFGADGTYGEVGESKTNEQAKAFAGYRRNISGRMYGLMDVTISYDAIADIDYRLILSPGLGYYLLKDDLTTLGLELGPSWIKEKVSGEDNDYMAVRAAERLDRKLSATAKCWESVEYLPNVDDLQDDYLINAEIGVEAQINAKASIRLVGKDTYDSTPADGREMNDLSIIGALVYTL